jgi:Fe-S cluster assembly protein SufB
VFDSVSVVTTFKEELAKAGVIFCSISEAIREHPELVKKYLGSVVPVTRQLLRDAEQRGLFRRLLRLHPRRACAARWSCRPISASTRKNTGQFERTLIIADKGSYVSYLEGCTAPQRDENQLHAAVVELVALDDAEIKYSTVQNWYPGDADGKGGIYNFVTKRGDCRARSKVSGRRSRPARRSPGNTRPASCAATIQRQGEFYSIAVTNNTSRPTPAPR